MLEFARFEVWTAEFWFAYGGLYLNRQPMSSEGIGFFVAIFLAKSYHIGSMQIERRKYE